MRDLVVTADDVGLATGMTHGALRAHDAGIVTACSVAANGAALDDAVRTLRERPRLAVGVHWVLTGERPLSPTADIPTLVGGDGRLWPHARAFVWRYLRGLIDLRQVELELGRQTARLRERGLALVHANSHQHLHLLPRLAPLAAELAERHGIPWLRVVREAAPGWRVPRGLEMRVLNRCGERARQGIANRRRHLTLPDLTLGVRDAGHLDVPRLAHLLSTADPAAAAVELVCHPGLGDAELGARYRWGYAWESETAALVAPATRAAVEAAGFRLTAPGAAAP